MRAAAALALVSLAFLLQHESWVNAPVIYNSPITGIGAQSFL